MTSSSGSAQAFLDAIGVICLPPATVPFDPGYDHSTFLGHLEQSAHLMQGVKLSMASWLLAKDTITRAKIAAAKGHGVPAVAGGGLFEIAESRARLEEYLDLLAGQGFERLEVGEGFAARDLDPRQILALAAEFRLSVQYEMGTKAARSFTKEEIEGLAHRGKEWLEAGAEQLVVEARESARGVGLFDRSGELNRRLSDKIVESVDGNLNLIQFEAPTKQSQFSLLRHFGPRVVLANVRLEELLRVETFRRGLHPDSFDEAKLRLGRPSAALHQGGAR